MFSKPVRVDTETDVKPAPKSFTITEYMKKVVIWTKYKIPELKQRITKIIATRLGVKMGFDL